MATDAEMVEVLRNALATGAGVVSISVDGVTVSYSREQALRELQFWEKRAARASGRRPRIVSIDLSGAGG